MTRRSFLLALVLATAVHATSCTKVYYPDEGGASPTAPTPMPAPTKTDKVEFRVFGRNVDTFTPVVVRHTDALNGVTLYSGGVPYLATFNSTDDGVFLFIEAQGTGVTSTSTLQVQIFVNGRLFRDGFGQGFTLSAQASGTFRR